MYFKEGIPFVTQWLHIILFNLTICREKKLVVLTHGLCRGKFKLLVWTVRQQTYFKENFKHILCSI